jgi:hypothetical protein
MVILCNNGTLIDTRACPLANRFNSHRKANCLGIVKSRLGLIRLLCCRQRRAMVSRFTTIHFFNCRFRLEENLTVTK